MAPEATLDLDALEREGKNDPFSVKLGGQMYVLREPSDCDYRELIDALKLAELDGDTPLDEITDMAARAFNVLVAESERGAFFANSIPAFKLQALFERYLEHHGLKPGEAVASSHS